MPHYCRGLDWWNGKKAKMKMGLERLLLMERDLSLKMVEDRVPPDIVAVVVESRRLRPSRGRMRA